jgi:hydroxymethylpyrimidine pyrophosphatase-like HAD family hydrolase
MFERIGVVLSDVDGTQIIPGQKPPSPAVQAAARGLRSHGAYLLEATSRSHALMRKLVTPLDLRNNLCTLDGGATVARADTGEVVWSQWLGAETTRDVVMGIGQLCTRIHFDVSSRGRSSHDVLNAIDNGQLTVESAPSVFAIFGIERGQEIIATLGRISGAGHTPIMGYENDPNLRCIQVVSPGVNKQYGVEQTLSYAGLSDRRKLAIGDGTNDFALFAAVGENGVKVAMGNAPDELKDLADWVAPSVVEDGFAVAMERYVLSV